MSATRLPLHPSQLAFLEGGRYHPLFVDNPTGRLEDRAAAFACPRCGAEILVEALRIHSRPGHPREVSIDGAVTCRAEGCGWSVDIRAGLCYERDLDPWDTRLTRKARRPITFEPTTREARQARAMMRRDARGVR